MSDKPFVINDRRKFTAEGELRPGVELTQTPVATETSSPEPEPDRSSNEADAANGKPHKEPIAFPTSTPKTPEPGHSTTGSDAESDVEESHQAAGSHETIAFPGPAGAVPSQEAAQGPVGENDLPPLTPDQIDQAARAYAATVERLDTALRAQNLGGEPLPTMSFERLVQSLYMQALIQLGGAAEPGQQPQVDIIGARQTIDMLALIEAKSKGNLAQAEDEFLQSALFEIRMGFLEITQALARQAAGRQPTSPGAPKGPGIVR